MVPARSTYTSIPGSVAETVALVDPVFAALAVRRAGQAFSLQLHQALGGKAHHLAQQIGI